MTEEWTIEFEGFEFAPIPQSWLEHPHAEDRGGQKSPRLYAVSAATYGCRTLWVRDGEPRSGDVLILQLPANELDSRGIVPEGLLTGVGWSRSLYPPARTEPRDVLRTPEERHLRELWAGRGLLPGEGQRRAVADGGGRGGE
jgi:hypothetical protein